MDFSLAWVGFETYKRLDLVTSLVPGYTRLMIEVVRDIAKRMQTAGGRALLVGGTVRDQLLKLPVKDYDLEIFGLRADQIRAVAEHFGQVEDVGKVFGILKLQVDGQVIDLAAPRLHHQRDHAGSPDGRID